MLAITFSWCAISITAGCAAPPWDCGFPAQTPRMQDTAEGFGQPIRQIFEPFFLIQREMPAAVRPQAALQGIGSRTTWYWIYLPIARADECLSALVGRLQHGRISVYLLYSFVTLLALLVFAQCHRNTPAFCFTSLPVAAGGADRAAAAGLGQPVPRLAAEPERPGRAAALSHAAQAVPQGRGARAQRLAVVPRHALYPVRLHVAGGGHRADARDRPALFARRPT